MKIAYKALYHRVLYEKEELLYQVDKLVEENLKMRDKVELYKAVVITTLIGYIITIASLFWIIK